MTEIETCWRCAAPMEWRHGTWQCPRCRFKLGCCEGEPQNCETQNCATQNRADAPRDRLAAGSSG